MATKPMQWTLKKLRAEGWECHIVEKFNRFSMRRVDAFGFGDVLAMRPGEIALVQTTSASNMAAHEAKIKSLATYNQWYEAGGTIILHGWKNSKTCREKKTQRNALHMAIDILAELHFLRILPKLAPEKSAELRAVITEIIAKGYMRQVKLPNKRKPCIAK
jgi:hypothetical protein